MGSDGTLLPIGGLRWDIAALWAVGGRRVTEAVGPWRYAGAWPDGAQAVPDGSGPFRAECPDEYGQTGQVAGSRGRVGVQGQLAVEQVSREQRQSRRAGGVSGRGRSGTRRRPGPYGGDGPGRPVYRPVRHGGADRDACYAWRSRSSSSDSTLTCSPSSPASTIR
jgi:hypothetical protein